MTAFIAISTFLNVDIRKMAQVISEQHSIDGARFCLGSLVIKWSANRMYYYQQLLRKKLALGSSNVEYYV